MSQASDSNRTRWFIATLAAYFCLQLAVRVALSPSTHLDESEQAVLTQSLQWGYGPQPPLYTWIQWAVFTVTGPGVLGLSLLKNALLFMLCLAAFALGRRATGAVDGGILAALALAFMPDLVWEAQRDLTHSVLAALFGLAAVGALVRMCDRRRWSDYLLFGLILGLGCLSKYNFALVAISLIAAALTLPEGRRALWDKRLLVALALAALVIAPHVIWVRTHLDLASASADKFKLAEGVTPWAATLKGLTKALTLTLGIVGPTALIFSLMVIGTKRSAGAPEPQPFMPRMLLRMLLVAALLVVAGAVLFHTANFRGRWFLPLLVAVPVLASIMAWPRLSQPRIRVLRTLALVVVAMVTVLLPARIVFAERLKRFEPLHQPYARLAPQLSPLIHSNTVVLATTKVIAGNLRLAGLGAVVVTPDTWTVMPHPGTDVLVVWDATRQDELQARFLEMLEPLGLQLEPATRKFEAPCYYHSSTMMELACARAASSQPPAVSRTH